ncbi:M56 family metallopeptidase [Yoonia sp. 2307UL14-13]|uniref:M56 family metallopeptidase n=1 Tax=Yoonia sp. 2307UL14-13 TaxID=3126506 RepID=UPI00309BA22B
MMPLETILHAYIDANIILALGALIWFAAQTILIRTRLRSAHNVQLQLIYGLLVAIAIAPFLAMFWAPNAVGLNLSDLVVAGYLDGHFAMAPTAFEALLATRDTIVLEVATMSTTAGQIVAAMGLAGICFATLRMIRNLTQVRQVVQHSYLWRSAGRVQVRLTQSASVPFSTRGLRNHYIILPAEMLENPVDLHIALAHEFQHVRQGDLTWECLLEILRPLFVFNPAMRYWKGQVERQRELACDQQVMQRKGLCVQDYANCLLQVCAKAVQRRDGMKMPVVALLQARGRGHARFLRHRIVQMIEVGGVPGQRWCVPVLLVPLVVAVGLGALSIQRSGDWSQDRLMLSTIVNLERLNQRNGTY